MAAYPIKTPRTWAVIPEGAWPPEIAKLQPWHVTVHRWGVDISVKRDFDGGWGYQVPRGDKRELPMLQECYWEASSGVFWHGPC